MLRSRPYDDSSRAEMVHLVPGGARRVLDVGCGLGGFGEHLRAVRPQVEIWGVEPDPAAAEVARNRLDRVLAGFFPDVPELYGETFDVIVFNDVLEHLPDPWSVLRMTRSFLSSGGVVVASVPNVRHISVLFNLVVHSDFKYEDEGILDRTHLRFFTRKSLRRMFVETGYSVSYLNPVRKSSGVRSSIVRIISLGQARDLVSYQYGLVAR